jgi:hypothetical protein
MQRRIAFLLKRDVLWKVVYITFVVMAILLALVIPALMR